jgi:hypothetical protein
MIAKLNLSTKFTLLLSIVCIVGLVASGFVLWGALFRKTQQDVVDKGLLLIEAMASVRGYTDTHMKPFLDSIVHGNTEFIPESVPAFAARQVFDSFSQNPNQMGLIYKEASLNPTNPKDKADDFESNLIKLMRNDRGITEKSDFTTINGKEFFYIARPLAVTSETCIACHGIPGKAPTGQIQQYGSQHGFGWVLNDVNSTQIIYVPASDVYNAAFRSFLLVMGIFGGSFVLVVLLINILLRWYVIDPVSAMGRLARKIRNDEMVMADLQSESLMKMTKRNDELGYLDNVFLDMAREVYTRIENLKQQVYRLRIEIDEQKRQKDVAAIVDSEFFKDLQAKAHMMRRRHDDHQSIS